MLPGKKYTPEDVLRIVLPRWWIFALPALATTTIAVSLLQYIPDMYRSETTVLVVPQRVPDSYVRSTVTARIEDRLQSITQQILSRSRLEPLITEFNLYVDERQAIPMEDVVNKMRLDIGVDPVRGDAFRVSFVSPDPGVAQKVTERLASLFIEENVRDREVLADATNQFLESQLQEARDRLIQHEKRLEAYRLRHSGELPSQMQSNIQGMQAIQAQVQGLTDSVARDRDRRLILEGQLADLRRQDREDSRGLSASGSGQGQAEAGSAQQMLERARRDLDALLMRLKPEHPDVVRAKRSISDLETKAAAEQKALASAAAAAAATDGAEAVSVPMGAAERAVADLRRELASLNRDIAEKEVKLASLHQEVDVYRSRIDAIPTRETEMVELMRDYDTLRAVYTDLLSKRENSKVAANLERRQIGEQFRVLDPARRPERPFSPNRPYYTALGTVVGLLFGVAIIALGELRDTTFHRDDDVTQSLGLPVLAVVPRMLNRAERRRRKLNTLALTGAVLVCGAGVAAFVAYRVWM